jgi:hypothetical protein
MVAWWMVQAGCLVATGWIFYRMMPLSTPWKINVLVALAGLLPIGLAVAMGHLVPVLLLILAAGFALHAQDRRWSAGVVLSAMALKPQFAVGLLIWLAIRRDFRAICGLAVGLLAQAATVSVVLGPTVCFDFLRAAPKIGALVRTSLYSPVFEQSFAGIVSNLMHMYGYHHASHFVPMRVAHVLTASLAALLLCRIVFTLRPWLRRELPPGARQCEYAAAVLFMLLFTPYLLGYDLTLLAVPLVSLWCSPCRWDGVLLYATTTACAAALYAWLGISLIGVAALWVMFDVGHVLRAEENAEHVLANRLLARLENAIGSAG